MNTDATTCPSGNQLPLPGGEALRRAMANPYRKWMYEGGSHQRNAGYRVRQGGLLEMPIKAGFTMKPGASVFSIGSCFARNVEVQLTRCGLKVASENFSLPRDYYYRPDVHGPRTALNKYSVHSIYFELLRVLQGIALPDFGFVQTSDAEWFDPHCSQVTPRSFDDCLQIRSQVAEATGLVRTADFVFITLGMTESWIDSELNVPINLPPKPAILRRLPDRFAFVNANFESVSATLKATLDLIRKYSQRDVKFIVTVSPVPIQTTYNHVDVIQANLLSKSILRVAAEELALTEPDVDYFPSYELVTMSPRSLVWADDEVHVQRSAIASVIETFSEAYICGADEY